MRKTLILLASLLLFAGACGSSDDETPAASSAESTDEADEQPTAAAPATVATTDLGDILVDAEGLTLYGFTEDVDGEPTCEGGCAEAWPPVIVDAIGGLDASVFSLTSSGQLKAGDWPLYLFAGDAAPGDVNGQGSGGVWFVVDAAGELIQ